MMMKEFHHESKARRGKNANDDVEEISDNAFSKGKRLCILKEILEEE